MKASEVLLIVAIISAIGVGWWLTHSAKEKEQIEETAPALVEPVKQTYPIIRDTQPPEPPSSMMPPADQTVGDPLPPIIEPTENLNDSDQRLKEAALDLSNTLAQWMTPKEQIRKWVSLVNNIAQGEFPVKNRPLDIKAGKFKVDYKNGSLSFSEDNFQRADPLITAITSTDQDLLLRYYRSWQPLLEQAYGELGLGDSFNDKLKEAIKRVIEVPILEDETIKLKQPTVFYTYADPELEKASDLAKFMWRMGPENSRRLKAYLAQWLVRLERSEPPPEAETSQFGEDGSARFQ